MNRQATILDYAKPRPRLLTLLWQKIPRPASVLEAWFFSAVVWLGVLTLLWLTDGVGLFFKLVGWRV